MWLTAKKKLENWVIWLVVDVLATGIYYYKGFILLLLVVPGVYRHGYCRIFILAKIHVLSCYHMKKIAVIGPESTGKTWLIAELAEHYDCPAVSEYARDYIDQLDRPYNKEDLLKIARGQLQAEDMVAGADVVTIFYFCDTDLRVIKIWSMYKYGDVHPWIDYQIAQRKYHAFYLLTGHRSCLEA